MLLTIVASSACDKNNEPEILAPWPEGEPESVVYYIDDPLNIKDIVLDITYVWIEITDAAGNNPLSNYATGKLPYDIFDSPCDGQVQTRAELLYNENGILRIRADQFAKACFKDRYTVTYQLTAPTLFGDEALHSFELGTECVKAIEKFGLNHYHRATSLTFDGQAIAPDADGVFVIRLPKKE